MQVIKSNTGIVYCTGGSFRTYAKINNATAADCKSEFERTGTRY